MPTNKTVEKVRIAQVSKTAEEWSTQNPLPLKGEICHEVDTNKVKIGDGTRNYNELPYIVDMEEISGSMTFENDNPMVISVGGYSAGTTFSEPTDLVSVIQGLLYPYKAPTVSATATPNGGVREYGNPATITQVVANWSGNSNTITAVNLKDGDSQIATQASPSGNSFTFSSLSVAVESGVNKRLTVEVVDDSPKTTTAQTGSFTWVYPFFYGATDNAAADVTAEEILAGTKNVTTKGTKSFNFTTNDNRPFIAYPASYGALTKITDGSGVTDYTNAFGSPATVAVTSTSPEWGPINYYVYTGAAATLSSFQFKFQF